jgi:hypothetical protein
MARAIPVFPEVASRIVLFLSRAPAASAYSMRYLAILSLMEPPALKLSSLTRTSASSGPVSLLILRRGVSPISGL